MEVFQNYSYYYNLFYGDKDYKSEARIIKDLIEKHKKQQLYTILNLGCGTGRHDTELVNLGYNVHGIDLSENMLEVARNSNKEISYEQADIRNYRSNYKYDACISLFHVMSYQSTNEDILKAFQAAYEGLINGGIFLFDVWYGPGVLTDKPVVRVKKVEDNNNKIVRYAEPIMHANKNIVDVCYEIMIVDKETSKASEIKEVHSMRYYFEPEIKMYLETAGFELVGVYDCTTLRTPDYNTWTAYFVAIKL